jgi:cysteinyl-tRNA synthetase
MTEPLWCSPWGLGRPGWHIECSTMAIKYLGHNFDIHGGGQDLIFPHHENEIAQSEGLFDESFAKTWMHVGMVTIKSEKMSKSIGNTIKISELLKQVNPNIVRLFCLSAHYSKPLDYSEMIIEETRTRWGQIENAYYELKYRIDNNLQYTQGSKFNYDAFKSECSGYYEEFECFIEENLSFSNALTSFFRFISKTNNIFSIEVADKEKSLFIYELLEKFMFVLGLKIDSVSDKEKGKIQELIKKRNTLRDYKNYMVADEIRKELLTQFNVELIDHKGFTVWKKTS